MQAEAQKTRHQAPGPDWSRRLPWSGSGKAGWLALAALLLAASLSAYLLDQAAHPSKVLNWYDLYVYNDAGLITRQLPSILYTWELKAGIQFTYTPFAGLVFAGGSLMPLETLRWLITIASLVSIPATIWLTLGAMGQRGRPKLAVTLALSALFLWIEPTIRSLYLGQIEPLLLLLVVWDLTRKDERRWKGVGIGLAAGIKLIPLLFIPYLLLCGKVRQAIVATATFAGTIVLGFVLLPGPSRFYWLTGYFIRPGRTGGVHSLVNQSLLAAIAREYPILQMAEPVWLPIAIVLALAGVAGGVALTRAGKPAHGWVLVGITAVIVSPISWDHHWVWIIPPLAMIAAAAMSSRGRVRAGYVALLLAITGVIGAWPWIWSGPEAFVPGRGLLGWFVRPPEVTQFTVLHGWRMLTWNLYIVIGIVIYLVLLWSGWRAWRDRQRPRRPEAGHGQNPLGALLARADSAFKSGNGTPLSGSGTHRKVS